jgi:SAM-dependent methyltransferase
MGSPDRQDTDRGPAGLGEAKRPSEEMVRDRLYARYTRRPIPAVPSTAGGSSAHYLRRLVRRHFPETRSADIVELGCGEGQLLRVLRALGYVHAVGVDRSPDQLARARAVGDGISVEQNDALVYLRSVAASSKDVVVVLDMLEHLRREEVLALLDEAHRVLRPDGRIVLHTVNAGSPFFGRIRYGDLTHELAFTPASLRQVFDLCGFRDACFFEDDPVVHGARSGVRWLLWWFVRTSLAACLTVETGGPPDAIFTQGFVALAFR